MSDIAIRVEGLSKRYLLGRQRNSSDAEATLRDNLVGAASNLLRRTRDFARGGALVAGDSVEEFWALKDVSFEVKRGEVVGIIGRNGAGKSTLLKILSRITEPTSGRISLEGRVSSLLEVGTGFHPELSGRENIYLNGAILGMSRSEIQSKFDEIVDFAEVEKFLDTPVKRYSSGMYVRLAFAVAAHLEPEILVVDEVLAVGDVQFQKKCLGKMRSVAGDGRTILFVSHSMPAIEQLTSTAVLLRGGELLARGKTSDVVAAYIESSDLDGKVVYDTGDVLSQNSDARAKILQLKFERSTPSFASSDDIQISAIVWASKHERNVRLSMTVFCADGTPVGSAFAPPVENLVAQTRSTIRICVRSPNLAPGRYYCGVSVGAGDNKSGFVDFDSVLNTLEFEVVPATGEEGTLATWHRSWGVVVFSGAPRQV